MNVRRFTARTSRDALSLVRQAFGDEAVVLSTRPSVEGVEVLAMAPDGVDQIERLAGAASSAAAPRPAAAATLAARAAAAVGKTSKRRTGTAPAEVQEDVKALAMSTLSFQDYVRERMLKRRRAALDEAAQADAGTGAGAGAPPEDAAAFDARRAEIDLADAERAGLAMTEAAMPASWNRDGGAIVGGDLASEAAAVLPAASLRAAAVRYAETAQLADPAYEPSYERAYERSIDRSIDRSASGTSSAAARLEATGMSAAPAAADAIPSRREAVDVVGELRAMKHLIEERFGALAFMEKLQRDPRQAQLTQRLFDCGFTPALIRKLLDGLPAGGDETAWATSVLEHNLATGEAEPALEEAGGVYALIGSTGVGKTTSTAKIAAAFAARHGAAHLGLVTLDAYRVGAHEQLRAYGRILGAPVHTAHDRASLEDLLDLLSAKKMVLIDTAGMAQRDSRTREMLEMLSHRAIQKLLVLDASSQGETIDDVVTAWRASQCKGIVLSKIDEAVKLAPALDALIRHKLKVVGVANGQRVPEDWHRLSSHALVHRALRAAAAPAYRLDADEISLVFASPSAVPAHAVPAMAAANAANAAHAAAHRAAMPV